jgi:TusA-related sulfurtransferase
MHAPEPMKVKEPSANQQIDTRGLLCPYPFIEAKQALAALPPGSTVEILTDSEPTATSSIPILCERSGYTFTTTRDGDLWVLVVEKP